MIAISVLLSVSPVRSFGARLEVPFSRARQIAAKSYVAVCDYQLIPNAEIVEKGQMWRIKGSVRQRTISTRDGFVIKENQIEASEAERCTPLRAQHCRMDLQNPSCTGFGQVKAQKLYDRFWP